MESPKKQKINLFTFILSGILFVMGGLLLILEDKTWLGVIQVIAGAFNFGVAILKSRKFKSWLELVILFFNILVAASVAWDYILEGKKYLQYAWIMAALLSAIAMIITLRKRKLSSAELIDNR